MMICYSTCVSRFYVMNPRHICNESPGSFDARLFGTDAMSRGEIFALADIDTLYRNAETDYFVCFFLTR